MVAGSFSEQRLMKSWTDLSHTVNVNIQAKDRFFSRHQNTVSGARASYAFDQSWHNPDGTSEGILRAEAHTHFTLIHFFKPIYHRRSYEELTWFRQAIVAARTSPNSPCVAKITEDRITIPPRWLKRHVRAEFADCERGFTSGFPMKNWCSFDAMTVRKRTISSLLSDLLSPISEPWNDVFHANKSP